MKSKLKVIVTLVSFLIVLSGAYYVVNETLKFKYSDGIIPMEDMYEYPDNSIDVLLLGSSHVGVNVDTVQLCENYGIAAYNLWGAVQPTWNSYHNLVEALKTQKPKVVVLETFLVSQDYEYMDYSRIIKNTMGMKLSKNKIEAILTSATPDVLTDVMLGFSTYHTRYNDLQEEDFQRYFWNRSIEDKNIRNGDYVVPCNLPKQVPAEETEELSEKMGSYFLKIIELCEAENIPLVLYTSPYSASEKEQRRYNKVEEIANQYGIPYINYNNYYEEIEIDFNADYCDSAGHFNDTGVTKMTNAIGSYLKEHYELPERFDDKWFNMKPETAAVFTLYEPFVGDGENAYMDTMQLLYQDPKRSYTILTKFQTECLSDNKIFLSCFSEEEPYRGLLVRKDEDMLKIIFGDNYYVETPMPKGVTATLAVTKEGNYYSVYVNGVALEENIESACESYGGTLLIGAEDIPESGVGRFSAVTVEQLEVYEEALSKKDIFGWMEENAAKLTKEEIIEQFHQMYDGEINYLMDDGFTGDGESVYQDTGVQLFYEPDNSWTFLMDFDTSIKSADGVFAGCFSEEIGKYRGLLIRQDDNALHIIVGENYYVEVMPEEDSSAKLAVMKDGDYYSVYMNGIPIATDIYSPCEQYIGTLLMGVQYTEDFDKFRYSAVTINRLEVKDELLTQQEIQRW